MVRISEKNKNKHEELAKQKLNTHYNRDNHHAEFFGIFFHKRYDKGDRFHLADPVRCGAYSILRIHIFSPPFAHNPAKERNCAVPGMREEMTENDDKQLKSDNADSPELLQ